jgi:guanylate kinase
MKSGQNSQKGTLFVLSAPSGCGKTSVLDELLALPGMPIRSITYTTRPMRDGEINGVDYHFVSQESFEEKRGEGFFLEWASVYENFYGTAKTDVSTLLDKGTDVIVSVDVQGAGTIRNQMEAVLFFLVAPSREELERRLRGRGTDTDDVIERRLQEVDKEMAQKELYDYVVTNNTVTDSVKKIVALIEDERNKRRETKCQ